ncbi:probable tubulin-specific chaperone D [Coccomyxa sp. Obi]|nr:probable tubulin-specific chaperone D [Coccomyxa sp. Obi]
MEEEEREEGFMCTYEATHVEEADELAAIVSSIEGSQDSAAVEKLFDRYHKILEKYHEQAQLLDPLLAALVTPLSAVLRREANSESQPDLAAVQTASRFLWALITVRGHKTVVKFFSSEVADLEPVLALLLRCDAEAKEVGSGLWQAQCTLLLWLSQLLYIPFSLASVDSSLSGTTSQAGALPPLTSKLLALSRRHLSEPGGVRDMAGVLLGRLLTRPDCSAALQEFLAWAHTALQDHSSPRAVFTVPGVVRTLAQILEQGQRHVLLPFARKLWPLALQLLGSDVAASSALSRKLALKLAQRVALAMLPPREAKWRYERRCTDIGDTLAGTSDAALGAENALQGGELDLPLSDGDTSGGRGASTAAAVAEGGQGGDPESIEVPDEVEDILGALLEGLADKDTVVRWSAAKGIGRISARLPKEMGDEVVEAVLDLFSDAERDAAWHGGCLALAELARRGLLLPHRLPRLAPLIASALQFDVRRGSHSVGAHVRDAAAYVCWAFARAYERDAMAEAAAQLAPALLAVACYDREVNCRRACSAAFQEAVGRQGSFPHGIDIICNADYFALAARSNAYLRVAPFVGGFEEYRAALVDHLIDRKLGHWERPLRELASRALAALVPTQPQLFAEDVIDRLLPMCLDGCLEVRHGAALALGEVVLALHQICKSISDERLSSVAGIVPALEAGRLYRGKGGELMRACASRLLECMALSCTPLTGDQKAKLLEIAEENLRHPSRAIQAASAAALHAFYRAYLTGDDLLGKGMVARYVEGLKPSAAAATRQGYAAALGALPRCLLGPHALTVIDALGAAAQVEADAAARDAESRAAAARALADVAAELFPLSPDQALADVAPEPHQALVPDRLNNAEAAHPCAAVTISLGADSSAPAKAGMETPTAPYQAGVPALSKATDGISGDEDRAETTADGVCAHGRAADVLEARVLRRLLTAAADYCTDDRGDVGSWVREAAMAALARVLPLWAAHRLTATAAHVPIPGRSSAPAATRCAITGCQAGASPSNHRSRDELGSSGPGAGAAESGPAGQFLAGQHAHANFMRDHSESSGAMASVEPSASCRSSAGSDGGEGLVTAVVCALLQQAAERLDRLRKAAAQHLQRLLQMQNQLPQLPEQRALEDAILGASPDLFATPKALPRLAPLLGVDAYREAVLEGMVACIGGLDGHLSKEASAALVQQTRASSAGEAGMREKVAASFIAVWRRNQKSPRLALPLLKAADVLYTEAGLEDLPASHTFPGELLELVKGEARGCRDVPSLIWAATSLCHLAGAPAPACFGALHALLTLLVNRYPKVRKSVAEQLYVRLLTLDDHPCYQGCDLDLAQQVLCDATWDGQLAEAKAARDSLACLLPKA